MAWVSLECDFIVFFVQISVSGKFKDKQPGPNTVISLIHARFTRAIGCVHQTAVIDIHIRQLDDTRTDLAGPWCGIGDRNVVADFAQVLRIGNVQHPHSRIHVGNPGQAVFEAVQIAVDSFCMLVRSKIAPGRAEITDWYLPG